MASTEDLVPVRTRRCPAWCSCGPFWCTKWLRKRLERPLSAQTVVGTVVFVAVCVFVFLFLSVQDAMSTASCESSSEALQIIFTVLVYLGIPCVAAVAFAIRRDPFMRDDAEDGLGTEGLELSLLFVPIVLLAVACVALDVVFFLLTGSCVHRDRGAFPLLPRHGTGLAFHAGRLVFVSSQVAMFGWSFRTRNFARQKVYTVLLFTFVVLADLASWFYEIVDRPSVLCSNDNTCWDATAAKADTCGEDEDEDAMNMFTVEYCTFLQFQLYCQPLVGTFALLSLPTMYYMWSKAREGEGGSATTDSRPEQTSRPRAGAAMQLFSVTVAVLSVGLVAITRQATTVSSEADYYKVIMYYSYKILYFGLFTISTLAGCMSVRAGGAREYQSRGADVLLLLLSAAGVLVLNVRAIWGWDTALPSLQPTAMTTLQPTTLQPTTLQPTTMRWMTTLQPTARRWTTSLQSTAMTSLQPTALPDTYRPHGCTHDITEGDFGRLRGLLMADAILNLVQLVLQTSFVWSCVTHRRLEGRVESHCGLLCLFNLCVWLNGSFLEVQSTPLTTCYTTPVQRAAFTSGDWNVFLHLLYPLCMFYWLWSLLLMARLLLQGVTPPRLPGVTTVQVGQSASLTIPMDSLS
ncbi:Hypp1648 [Branchiostoma lanceolatum]|uniref:Hypp1648 protein n=1 Tax=Branchiostoma lanceolatum TaxID=7740 RepID=A0A8J9ZLI2_BRALA|nr:Hypp1648 [Branchiostoma lanceolatum]